MILDSGKFYLYRHIRLDKNEPFYIGVGSKEGKKRKDGYDRAFSKTGRTKYWKNIVNINPNYEVEILLESNDYSFILQKEIEFIALYGRKDLGKGPLVNLTDGGEGNLGRIYKTSEETKKKLSLFNKGKKMSEESKMKISKVMKGRRSPMTGKKQSKEWIEMIKKVNTGRKRTEKQKLRMSNAKKGKILLESTYKWRYKPIIQYNLMNEIIREWNNIRDASNFYKVGTSEISTTCKAQAGGYPIGHKSYNRKTCKGYIWKYKQN